MKKGIFAIRLILLVCLAVGFVSTIHAATFTVNSMLDVQDNNPGNGSCATGTLPPSCTLRAAITEANALAGDDVIVLPAGTYTEALTAIAEDANAGGDFDITSNITINGAGAGSTIIQAASSANSSVERLLHFKSGTSIVNDVTLRYGGTVGGGSGGGIVVDGFNGANTSVTLNSVTVSDNTSATFGGGIVVVNNGTLTTNNSIITNNFAGGDGAGIYATGTAVFNGTTVSSNRAVSNASSGTISGGGIYCSCALSLNNSMVSGNTVAATGNLLTYGGGLFLVGTTTISNSSITNNAANSPVFSRGGGIYAANIPLTINRTFISGNRADEAGGIRARVTRTGPPSFIIATYINQSAIINNTGTRNAGGILIEPSTYVAASEPLAVVNNSTIAGNRTNGIGGGIVSRETGSQAAARIEVNYSTIARNVADEDNTGDGRGGGVFVSGIDPNVDSSPIYLKGSVVADNAVGTGSFNPDISGPVLSEGYNHIENLGNATFTPTLGDATGSDPMLGALTLNGTNSVFVPAASSPLIDAIPNGANGCGASPFDVDQRGTPRPMDSNGDATTACEKGAAEISAPTAASASVSGRVLNANGIKGVARARVTLTDSQGQTQTALTNMFGYYRFEAVAVGETYIVAVSSEMLSFRVQAISVFEEIADLNFIADS